ncbi:asparagine synthase-related protein [Oceanobacillus profundus]|uniref:asparagine synthase-related protein n=1 Tax=Oceanobacillus profundus TaxID=372463 RepID=UPI0026E3524D|nr:asparagine synthase-related protein [Oceanobacillus profundus]MDO6450503.1 asparagine synthase-related protein [Oceanobacillus profundus]
MEKINKKECLVNKNIGGAYPYFYIKDNQVFYSNKITEILENNSINQRELDVVSVYSMLSLGYVVGDYTLLKSLKRLAWRSELDSKGNYSFFDFKEYNKVNEDTKVMAKSLLTHLEDELRKQCLHRKNVYILLSGGMDSRVVASIINKLEKNSEISAQIHGVTWGVTDSRDVVYARNICEKYNWNWHYAELNADYLIENFNIAAIDLAAEISPVHVHRYNWFKNNATKEDVVIAGSYGDSVGRAEYSSVRVEDLTPLSHVDKYDFLKLPYKKYVHKGIENRLKEFRDRYPNATEAQLNEYERQAHYMRRMLGNVANIINNWSNFYQAFTDEETAKLMFRYSYSNRTDEVYKELLTLIDPSLLKIAWARTGLSYSEEKVENIQVDKLSKNHHKYGSWMRENNRDYIEERLFDGTLEDLGIFDLKHLRTMFKLWQKEPINIHSRLNDRISWLTVLSIFIKHYNVNNTNRLYKTGFDLGKVKSVYREGAYILMKSLKK